MEDTSNQIARTEKKKIALSSVIAAIFLTMIKIVVGILTNSLGILSEAAHSGLDLIAAGVTYLAVRVSDQPPDRVHQYGHGKVESLSALFETLLLLATCAWIVYEAISRLITPVHVEATVWSFIVMGTSIVVDFSRSRALMRTAKKYKSQALEADALHFSTDIWSSSVVILGLVVLRLAPFLEANLKIPIDWLYRADAIAALGVSGIVVYVSYKLGRKTINVLLDAAEVDAVQKIEEAVASIQDGGNIQRIRVRHSGAETFVDLNLEVSRTATMEESHLVSTKVEKIIENIIPRSDVMVHIEPVVKDPHSLIEVVRSVAALDGLRVHGIRAHDIMGRLSLEMHVEIPEAMTIVQAHERVSAFEEKLQAEIEALNDIVTHIEPIGDQEVRRQTTSQNSEEIQNLVLELGKNIPGICDIHEMKVHSDGDEHSITFHCYVEPNLTVSRAHVLTIELESEIRKRLPEVGRIIIHTEPYLIEDDKNGDTTDLESSFDSSPSRP